MTRFATKTKNATIASVAAIGILAAGASVAPTQAHAGGKWVAAAIGGAIVGGIIANHHNRHYQQVYYGTPVYHSCRWIWQTRYNSYGQPYSVKVKVCG